MEYRRANQNDVDIFVENRMKFVTSIREINDIDGFKNRTRQYIKEHIDSNDIVIFLALERGRIASSCMACIYHTVPKPSSPNGVSAELLNVYTLEEYRRQGHAEKLIGILIQELKKYGVEKLILDYTDLGLPLYQKLGFVAMQNQMQLKL